MVMFISFSLPGPRADPPLRPTFFARGPFTTSIGACGLVDISKDLPPSLPRTEKHFTPAIIIGMCSGFAPAIAELIAICSTVAIPNPGGMSQTTSSAFKLVPAISLSTASLVGGSIGRASDQSRAVNC